MLTKIALVTGLVLGLGSGVFAAELDSDNNPIPGGSLVYRPAPDFGQPTYAQSWSRSSKTHAGRGMSSYSADEEALFRKAQGLAE